MRKPKGSMKKAKGFMKKAKIDATALDVTALDVTTEPSGEITTEPSDEVKAERLAALENLLGLMRPAVQADGGDLVLVSADVVHGRVEVMLQGSCSSCAISSTTLQAGVERILRDRLDWVSEVLGSVDESLSLDDSMAMGQGGYVPKF
ncbi:MAG: NifU family protein [Acidimicrobiales bacterium]